MSLKNSTTLAHPSAICDGVDQGSIQLASVNPAGYPLCDLGFIIFHCPTTSCSMLTQLLPGLLILSALLFACRPERAATAAKSKRIVSLSIATDEILTALPHSGKLVGVSQFSRDPSISNCAGLIPRDAIPVVADAETILALTPDLVFTTAFVDPVFASLLRGAGVQIVTLQRFESLDNIFQNVVLVGETVGQRNAALTIVAKAKQQVASLAHRTASLRRPRVLYIDPGPFTQGKKTLMHDLIERAGGINVAAEAGIVGLDQLSTELAIALRPEVILVSAWGYGNDKGFADDIRRSPLWQKVPAVKIGKVFAVNGAYITAISQYAVLGLVEIARSIHPELQGLIGNPSPQEGAL